MLFLLENAMMLSKYTVNGCYDALCHRRSYASEFVSRCEQINNDSGAIGLSQVKHRLPSGSS